MSVHARHLRRLFSWCAFVAGTVVPALNPASAAPVKNESYRWANVAVGAGGLVSGLMFHPTERNLLYARTDVGGAYRWDAAHEQWIPLNDDLPHSSALLLGVVSFSVDAHDPDKVYLACGSYVRPWAPPAVLLASSDRGATWTHLPLPFKLGGNENGRTTGERLAVDPHDGRVLVLGSNQDGLWRSADRGHTWKKIRTFPQMGLTFVLFNPLTGRDGQPTPVIYAGADHLTGPALYRSADAGETWSAVPGQPAGVLVHHAEFAADGTLFLTFANGLGPNDTTTGSVWKLDPATERWTDLTPLRPDPAAKDTFGYAGLALDPQHPGTILVSTLDRWTRGDEIFRSTDGGTNWKPMLKHATWDASSAPYVAPMKPHWIGDVALDPFDAGHALFITGYGVWATHHADAVDHGESTPWVFADNHLEETVVAALISPPQGARLISAIWDIAGFRHDDFSHSPASGAHAPAYGNNPSIDFAGNVPAKLVRTHSGPARGALSLDGGRTWRDFPSAPPEASAHGPGIVAIGADGGRIVWVPKGSAPYFSADDGRTWTRSRTDFLSTQDWQTCGAVADRADSEKFYLYDRLAGRVYISTDGGVSFSPTKTLPVEGGTPRAEPGRAGSIWVPTPQGLFHSTDSGRTFSRVEGVDTVYQIGFGQSAPGRANAALYLAGKIGDIEAIFRSDDEAKTWMRITDPRLAMGMIKVVTGDPRQHGRVYIGTGGRGIFYGEPATH